MAQYEIGDLLIVRNPFDVRHEFLTVRVRDVLVDSDQADDDEEDIIVSEYEVRDIAAEHDDFFIDDDDVVRRATATETIELTTNTWNELFQPTTRRRGIWEAIEAVNTIQEHGEIPGGNVTEEIPPGNFGFDERVIWYLGRGYTIERASQRLGRLPVELIASLIRKGVTIKDMDNPYTIEEVTPVELPNLLNVATVRSSDTRPLRRDDYLLGEGRNLEIILPATAILPERIIRPYRRPDGSLRFMDQRGVVYINDIMNNNVRNVNRHSIESDAVGVRWVTEDSLQFAQIRTTAVRYEYEKPRKKLHRKRPIPDLKSEEHYASREYIA